MIGYVRVGTDDLTKAAAFFDKVFEPLGVSRVMEEEGYFIAWGTSMEAPSVAASIPFNQEKATAGNGTMVALAAPDTKTVDKIYAKAMELGGTCEGEPGIREAYSPNFYVAYFRDLDGNKFNAFHIKS